jgi:BASS family bile acid:Na+ symporter
MFSQAEHALGWLGRRATAAIAGGVFVGLLLPPAAALLRPLLLPAILLPFVVALLRLDWTALRRDLRRPLLPALAVGWGLLASPALVAAALAPLPIEPGLRAAMVTTAACAPLMASGALALLLGLEVGLAVLVTVLATALVPFTLPPLALGLAGLVVPLDPMALSLRLLLLVLPSFALARGLRALIGRQRLAALADPLAGLAVLGLVLFAVGIMDGVTARAVAEPGMVAGCLLAAAALNVALQGLTATIAWPCGRRRALTLGLVAGNNNLGLVIAAMLDRASQDLLVFVAMAQLPIYLLPLLQQPLYRRLLRDGR